MRRLRAHPQWQAELRQGKTLGVLTYDGGFLAAFSGTLGGSTVQEGFVPPVFDVMHPGSYFLQEEAEISAINKRLAVLKEDTSHSSEEGCRLRHERKVRSQALQRWLFSQYRFLNARGEERSLPDIVPFSKCMSGQGDCCAPKLLQEAYRRGLTPLAVAEWDAATGEFCPPCTMRCRPILEFMLQGLDAESDPRMVSYEALVPQLLTVYEDERVLLVDKPSGLLSVPGKEFLPSVESVTGLLSVHRLDQDTSGLMLLAKDAKEQSALHRLFESRQVEKRYEAFLEHEMPVGEEYVANDLYLDSDKQQIIILTGPNMAGKSALLRQTALITILAQIGSFVPADSARIGLTDKIFTRVGASDNISVGESTFMVEMNEAASILNNLSARSLVLFDELGRGTSTYDGISIAWAIVEHIHENAKAHARTLFATHYHELNEMEKMLPRVKNFNVSVKEVNGRVIFMRKLLPGGSEHSFGIHVAKIAGMAPNVVTRAEQVLKELEANNSGDGISRPKTESIQTVSKSGMQLSFFQLDDPVLCQIRDEIANLDINSLTPLEALNKLNEIKKIVKGR